jgi:hypothetical protein
VIPGWIADDSSLVTADFLLRREGLASKLKKDINQ